VFVVHFVGPADGADVRVVASGKPFKALVYNYFVYNKIGKAIHSNTKANGGYPIQLVLQTEHNAEPAWDGEYEKEGVVFFEEAGAFLVMIFVKIPEEPMHYIPVGKPGNAFHYKKSE